MKREIKCRGKRIDNGKWVTGFLLRSSEESASIVKQYGTVDISIYDVIPKTVGQFTGLQNGKKIFDGDIVTGINRITEEEIPQKVTFLNGCFMFGSWNAHEYFNKHQFITVIGNIHENLSLSEVAR